MRRHSQGYIRKMGRIRDDSLEIKGDIVKTDIFVESKEEMYYVNVDYTFFNTGRVGREITRW